MRGERGEGGGEREEGGEGGIEIGRCVKVMMIEREGGGGGEVEKG
jgi:hypothetical protein